MQPIHEKVVALFDGIMNEKNDIYDYCFAENSERVLWFGKTCGIVGSHHDVDKFPRKSGPIQYWNRIQYFGDHVYVERHTATFLDKGRNHPKSYGSSMEILACCELDDNGDIIRFEEFADPSMMGGGKRPVPAPQNPPNKVIRYDGENCGDAKHNDRLIQKAFDNIMLEEDSIDLYSIEPVCKFAQMFATSFFIPNYLTIKPDKNGKIIQGAGGRAIYTNRRRYSGEGWSLELHTVTLSTNPKKPTRRITGEVAAFAEVSTDGKIKTFLEYASPNDFKIAKELAKM